MSLLLPNPATRSAHRARVIGCLALSLVLIGNVVQASDALRTRVASAAKHISLLLAAEDQDKIALDPFTSEISIATGAGPGLVQMFSEEFARHGIAVHEQAAIKLIGSYGLTEVPVFDAAAGREVPRTALRLHGRLVGRSGTVLADFNVEGAFDEVLVDTEAVVEAGGISVALDPQLSDAEQDAVIRQQLASPEVCLDAGGTRLRASPDSPYEIEILVDGRPRRITLREGLPFVDIREGELYQIRVHNHSTLDAAVRVLIDGLSVFTFSDVRESAGPRAGQPKYSVYVVKKNLTALILGWHKTNRHVAQFLVSEYAESAAAKLGHTQGLGTITVHFSAAWPKEGPVPADEFTPKGAEGFATAEGPPLGVEVQEAERTVGRIRASLTIRYTR